MLYVVLNFCKNNKRIIINTYFSCCRIFHVACALIQRSTSVLMHVNIFVAHVLLIFDDAAQILHMCSTCVKHYFLSTHATHISNSNTGFK